MSSKVIELKTERVVPITRDRQLDLNASTLSAHETRKQLGLEQVFDDVLDSKSEEPKDVIYE